MKTSQGISRSPMADDPLWTIRWANPTDHAFVCATWINSYRASRMAALCHTHAYARGQKATIELLLDRQEGAVSPVTGSTSTVAARVACCPEDVGTVFGYLISEPAIDERGKHRQVIHYVYVKSTYRRFGIARALFEDMLNLRGAVPEEVVMSHQTRAAEDVLAAHPDARPRFGFKFSPYLSYFPDVEVQDT